MSTRASNAEVHPGKVILESQQKWRGSKEMAEHREAQALQYEEERLNEATKLCCLSDVHLKEKEVQEKVPREELAAAKPQSIGQKQSKSDNSYLLPCSYENSYMQKI